jgi:hypothetical protein
MNINLTQEKSGFEFGTDPFPETLSEVHNLIIIQLNSHFEDE